MSLLLALLLTAIQVGDRYVTAWAPAFDKPAPTTLRVPYGPRVVRDRGTGRAELKYEHRRVLIERGTLLNPEIEAHWTAYVHSMTRRPPHWPRLLGVFVIFFTLSMALTSYLRKLAQSRLRLLRTQVGLLALIAGLALTAKGLLLFTALPAFWIPASALPLWVATGFDRRTAFVVTVVLAFFLASLLEFDLALLSVILVRGMGATLLYLERKHPRHMILAGTLAGLSAAAFYLAIMVTFEGGTNVLDDLSQGMGSQLLGCVGGGALAGLGGALFRSPADRLLGHVPREKLLDLQDLSQPLLRKLAREAPGTYEHSRAMANLAEQAASAIGADALLTRLGAYYHDLGKTAQCKYFVENLEPNEKSPHDDLDPDVSADAIMSHVVVGTKILREGRIPEPVVEFAYTHHGTQVVEYFWNKCKQEGNPKGLDESYFRYPGMKPQTKETAILMLVDSIEAASRTIDPPKRVEFEGMIERVIFTKLKQGQLDDCGLDLQDLRTIVTRMADTLVNMNHHRIKYQWQRKQAEEFGVSSGVMRDSTPEIEVHRVSTAPPPPPVSAAGDAGEGDAPAGDAPAHDDAGDVTQPSAAQPRESALRGEAPPTVPGSAPGVHDARATGEPDTAGATRATGEPDAAGATDGAGGQGEAAAAGGSPGADPAAAGSPDRADADPAETDDGQRSERG